MCKISVIVPVYNIDQYLDRCVSSIISQSCFEQLEVILVNDGSTDKSPDKCQEYAKKYSNMELPHTAAPLFISFRILTQMASLPYAAHPPYSPHFEA